MSEELQKEVGETIRLLRLLLRLSYAELTERSGVSSTYLRQVERGERDLGMDLLDSIAKGLGCNLPRLLPGQGRSAVALAFADGYEKAPDAVQEAIVFLLAEPEGSPKQQAILSVVEDGTAPAKDDPPSEPSSPKAKR